MTLEELKYPIGKFKKPEELTEENLNSFTATIASFPKQLRAEVAALSDEQLDTLYRPDGWSIRQVVNHCADSHMNSLVRLKLVLTEDTPVIKPYHEELWAELPDSRNMPLEPALKMLEGIHERWTVLLNTLQTEQLERGYIHPAHGNKVPVSEYLALYAWHCAHHLAHITNLKKSKGWY